MEGACSRSPVIYYHKLHVLIGAESFAAVELSVTDNKVEGEASCSVLWISGSEPT